MFEHKRSLTRQPTFVGARVLYNDRKATLSGIVRDRSDGGCLVKFGALPCIPQMVEVLIDGMKTPIKAQVVRRDGLKVGFAFLPD